MERAFAPQSVTLLLDDDLGISRGDMIVKNDTAIRLVKEFEADVCWLGEQPLDQSPRVAARLDFPGVNETRK